jgi:hypothetical protein
MSREHGVFVVLIVRKFRIEVRFGMEERETVREKKGAAEIDVVEEMAQGRPIRVRVLRGEDGGRGGMSSVIPSSS